MTSDLGRQPDKGAIFIPAARIIPLVIRVLRRYSVSANRPIPETRDRKPHDIMKSLHTFFGKRSQSRIATMLLVSLLWLGAPVQNADAADALTTAATNTVGKNFLGSIFKRRNAGETTQVTAMERVNRSILGLPLGILRGVVKGVSRMASKTVTDHITHY